MDTTTATSTSRCFDTVPQDTKILVIESSGLQTKSFIKILATLGYANVRTCASAEEALAALDAEAAELIFCDWQLPEAAGKDILRHVRSHPAHQKTPFVFVASLAERLKAQAMVEPGITDLVVKPLSPAVVDQKLRTIKLAR